MVCGNGIEKAAGEKRPARVVQTGMTEKI